MNDGILLVGGGGHAKSVIDSLLQSKDYQKIGIVVNDMAIGTKICGIKVVGHDQDLENLRNNGYSHAFISVGSVGNTSLRRRLYQLLEKLDFTIPNIIDPTSTISPLSQIGLGNFIGKKAIVNSNAIIKNNSIVNTGVIVEHDSVVEDFVHLSPGTVLSGGVKVESDSHLGSNTVVKNGITIGTNTLIGIGSVVVNNISENKIAYGNPCKEIRGK